MSDGDATLEVEGEEKVSGTEVPDDGVLIEFEDDGDYVELIEAEPVDGEVGIELWVEEEAEVVAVPVVERLEFTDDRGPSGPPGTPGEPGPVGNLDHLEDLTLIYENGLI